jgi:hypothetical protein
MTAGQSDQELWVAGECHAKLPNGEISKSPNLTDSETTNRARPSIGPSVRDSLL